MKLFNHEQLLRWFGFTRRERRSSFILLVFIVMIAGARFIVPGRGEPVEAAVLDVYQEGPDTIKVRGKAVTDRPVRIQAPARRSAVVIELNSCDSAMLEALPGIGPVLSARIIKFRNLLGGFVSPEQLREVYGLSEDTWALVRERIKADTALVRKININTAEYRELIRLPYFNRDAVSAILKYRELMGKIQTMDELVENNVISAETAEKVKLYMEY